MKKVLLVFAFATFSFASFGSDAKIVSDVISDLANFPKSEETHVAQAKKSGTASKGVNSSSNTSGKSTIPSGLFARYAGKWTGDFWVYSPDGILQESKRVLIEFKNSGKNLSMETFYLDRISKNWVVAETATYTNQGNKVKVSIRRPNNEMASQTGYYSNGSLFLTSDNVKNGVEHYRETIDGQRLLLDGFGIYGNANDSHIFIGRFVKQK